MSKSHKASTDKIILAETLGQRVAQLRLMRNMTVRDLAKSCRFSSARIEDIESGIETWFSTTERQLIARALRIDPSILQEVEKRSKPSSQSDLEVAAIDIERIKECILEGERDLQCPACGDVLKCNVQEGFDLEDKPIFFPKAFCLRCPFILR